MPREIVQYKNVLGIIVHALDVNLAEVLDAILLLQFNAEIIQCDGERRLVGGLLARAELQEDQKVREATAKVALIEVVHRLIERVQTDAVVCRRVLAHFGGSCVLAHFQMPQLNTNCAETELRDCNE